MIKALLRKRDKMQEVIAQKVTGKIVPAHDTKGHHYSFICTDHVVDSVTTINGILSKEHLQFWAAKMAVEFIEKPENFEKLKTDERQKIITASCLAYRNVRDEAAHVGSQAHNAIEDYINAWIIAKERPQDIRTFFAHEKGNTGFGLYLPDLDISLDMFIQPRAVASARAAERIMIEENIIPIASEMLVGIPHVSAGTLDFLCLWKGKLAIWDWKTSNQVDTQAYPLQVAAYKVFFEKMTGLKIEYCMVCKLSKDKDAFEMYNVTNIKEAYRSFFNLSLFYHQWWTKENDYKITKQKNKIK